MSNDPQSHEAELARLADGSLPGARAAELRDQVLQSPELSAALAEQERAVALVRSADPPAPDSLRRWVDEQSRAAAPARRRRHRRMTFAVPAVAAVAAAVIAVIMIAGNNSGPTLDQTSHLATASAVAGPPAIARGNPVVLNISNAGIPFPNWEPINWRPVGARVDRIRGRTIVTVFYKAPQGYRVGYAIVDGAPIKVSGGVTKWSDGVRYTFVSFGSTRAVTWEREGHTCVIAGHEINDQTLLHLASV
jgi:hypothetical protein